MPLGVGAAFRGGSSEEQVSRPGSGGGQQGTQRKPRGRVLAWGKVLALGRNAGTWQS